MTPKRKPCTLDWDAIAKKAADHYREAVAADEEATRRVTEILFRDPRASERKPVPTSDLTPAEMLLKGWERERSAAIPPPKRRKR